MPVHYSDVVMGEEYEDTITGFIGKATGVYFYLTGCTRVALEGVGSKKEGKVGDDLCVDSPRLKRISDGEMMDVFKMPEPFPEPPVAERVVPVRSGGPKTVTRRGRS